MHFTICATTSPACGRRRRAPSPVSCTRVCCVYERHVTQLVTARLPLGPVFDTSMIHVNITTGLMTERSGRKQPAAAEYQTIRQHSLVYLHGARYIYTQMNGCMSIPGCRIGAFSRYSVPMRVASSARCEHTTQ